MPCGWFIGTASAIANEGWLLRGALQRQWKQKPTDRFRTWGVTKDLSRSYFGRASGNDGPSWMGDNGTTVLVRMSIC